MSSLLKIFTEKKLSLFSIATRASASTVTCGAGGDNPEQWRPARSESDF